MRTPGDLLVEELSHEVDAEYADREAEPRESEVPCIAGEERMLTPPWASAHRVRRERVIAPQATHLHALSWASGNTIVGRGFLGRGVPFVHFSA